jgi:transposase InsO family protein
MGLVQYFTDYVPMISRIAAPINMLRHDADVKNKWTTIHDKSLESIKQILLSKHILHYPDMSAPFSVYTDASQYACSAALTQLDEMGRIKHVAFFSKALGPSARRWSTSKRECYAIVLALKKFRFFLYNNNVTFFCDHVALCYLHTQKLANPILIGWLETLLEFTFKVVHLPGIHNILADQLSRLYPPLDEELVGGSSLVGDGLVPKQTSRVEKKNKFYKKRIIYSKDKNVNILALKIIDKQNNPNTTGYMTPPVEDRAELLADVHKFGHYGSSSIIKEIHRKGLHWNSIYEEAKTLTSSCKICQKHTIMRKGYHGLTSVTAFLAFDKVAIDLCGPLMITENHNVYLFVMVDICTKYIIARAIPDKQSTTIIKTILSITTDYGYISCIQSDNGSEFKNSLMNEVCSTLNIKRIYSTPYHSRGNGAAENAVKLTMNTIRKMCDSNPQDWDLYVGIAQLAMNHKIRERTNSSPFALMFGRSIRIPNSNNKNETDAIPNEPMTIEELEKRNEFMSEIVFPAIKERTLKITKLQEEKFNRSNKLINIPENAAVMIKLTRRENKLSPIYKGPYFVVKRTKGGSYVLKDEQDDLLHREYVPSELKVVTVDETEIEDNLYEVEEIRTHRGDPGNREYLIRWKGYGSRSDTWERADAFTDLSILNTYWEKLRSVTKIQKDRSKTQSIKNSSVKHKENSRKLKYKLKNETSHENLRRSKRARK